MLSKSLALQLGDQGLPVANINLYVTFESTDSFTPQYDRYCDLIRAASFASTPEDSDEGWRLQACFTLLGVLVDAQVELAFSKVPHPAA